MTTDPLDGLWIQESLTGYEHPVLTIRIGMNKRRGTGSIGVKIHDGDTEDLLGMWAGPVIQAETVEAQAATAMAICLQRLGMDLKSQDPF